MKLNEKIFDLRKKAGLSQEALAEKLGVSRQAVSKWETGESVPELAKLVLIAKTFGVTTDWLLSEEGETADEPSESNDTPANNWVESIPGVIGKLCKKYGWLFGVYVAIAGGILTMFGVSAKLILKSFSDTAFDMVYGFGGTTSYGGSIPAGLFDDSFTSYAPGMNMIDNSMSGMNTIFTLILILGIILIIAGIVLAVWLKRKGSGK